MAWVKSAIEVASRLRMGLLVARRTPRDTRLFVREIRDALSDVRGWTVVIEVGKWQGHAPTVDERTTVETLNQSTVNRRTMNAAEQGRRISETSTAVQKCTL